MIFLRIINFTLYFRYIILRGFYLLAKMLLLDKPWALIHILHSLLKKDFTYCLYYYTNRTLYFTKHIRKNINNLYNLLPCKIIFKWNVCSFDYLYCTLSPNLTIHNFYLSIDFIFSVYNISLKSHYSNEIQYFTVFLYLNHINRQTHSPWRYG